MLSNSLLRYTAIMLLGLFGLSPSKAQDVLGVSQPSSPIQTRYSLKQLSTQMLQKTFAPYLNGEKQRQNVKSPGLDLLRGLGVTLQEVDMAYLSPNNGGPRLVWTLAPPVVWNADAKTKVEEALKMFVNQVMGQDVLLQAEYAEWEKAPNSVILVVKEASPQFAASKPSSPVFASAQVVLASPQCETTPLLTWNGLGISGPVIPAISQKVTIMSTVPPVRDLSAAESSTNVRDVRVAAEGAYDQGVELYWQGRNMEALTSLKQATSWAGDDARYWYFRSLAELAAGDHTSASTSASEGARWELKGLPDARTIGMSLVRVQGAKRHFLAGVVSTTRRVEELASHR